MRTTVKTFLTLTLLAAVGCGAGVPNNRNTASSSTVGLQAMTDGVLVKMPHDGARVMKGDVVAELQSSRATLRAENADDELRNARRSGDAARIASARAEQEAATRNLANLEIRTPIDGIVENRAVRIGQPIGAGAVVVAIIRETH